MKTRFVEWAELRAQVRESHHECYWCDYFYRRVEAEQCRRLAPMRRAYRVRTLARRRRR